MRGRLTTAVALATALAVACAYRPLAHAHPESTAYCPLTSYSCGSEGLEVSIDGRFRPVGLPKKRLAPIHLAVSGRVNAPVGSHPSALEEVVLETDRNVAVDARGLSTCRVRIDLPPEPNSCKGARLGEGEIEFEVEFPETNPFAGRAHVIVFNHDVRGGKRTVFLRAFLPAPLSAAVVIWVKISKVHRGRYGTRWVATIPTIAGGFGWMRSLNLKLFRRFTYKGKMRSFLSARCADGKLLTRLKAVFAYGPDYTGYLFSPCTPRR